MSAILTGRHQVDDRLIEARLAAWMTREANGMDWWVVGVTKDRKVIAWDNGAGVEQGLRPPKDREHYALRVLSALNAEAGFDGVWLVAWMDKCRRFYLLWKDRDGDIHIPIECDKSWVIIREWRPDTWIKMAVGAWAQWREFQKNLDLREDQVTNLAEATARGHA